MAAAAPSRFVLLSVVVFFFFVAQIRADASASLGEDQVEVIGSNDGSDSLKVELEKLNSKIRTLESLLDKRTEDLKTKDDILVQKEKIIEEKFSSIASLQNEVASLQKEGKRDAQEQVGKAHARAGELENQVDRLKKELERHNGEKAALKTRITDAEEKTHGLNLKLQELQKINDEQKTKIRKTERALKIAEEEMMKAKIDATSKTKELMKVHGAWLPPWLAVHFLRCRSFVEKEWDEHGKPVMNVLLQKTLEKKAQVGKWAEPHVVTMKTKWMPAMKEQWLLMVGHVEPHVQFVSTKAAEFYEGGKVAITPHIAKAQEIVDPYLKQVRKASKPYIDQVATLMKPHVDKVRTALKPHSKKVVRAYGKSLKFATAYHNQVQGSVQEILNKHDFTRSIASRELVWFAASALLALPIMLMIRVLSVMFGKKTKKTTTKSNTSHARRRAKRVHPDK